MSEQSACSFIFPSHSLDIMRVKLIGAAIFDDHLRQRFPLPE